MKYDKKSINLSKSTSGLVSVNDENQAVVEAEGLKAVFDLDDQYEKRALEYFINNKNANIENSQLFVESNQFKAVEGSDDFDGIIIEGYLSTFKNSDRVGDIVADEAFKATIKDIKKNRGGILPALVDHNSIVRSQVGSHRDFKIDDTGLKVRTYISKTPETLHAIKLIEDGSLNTYSMGGIFTYGRDEDGTMCIIEKVDLFEGSIVVIPANPQAQFVKKSFLEKAKELPSSADDGKPKQVPKKELTKDEKAKNIIKKMKGKK